MRAVDYVIEYIWKELKVNMIFTVTGGGAMFLDDAIAKCENIQAICNHHEQASAMAALGFAKYSNNIGVVCVTSGCGGTNALTGILDAYQDNTPLLILSGQVKLKETSCSYDIPLRQFGVQEVDIVSIVKPITKYAVTIVNADEIVYHLQKAVYLARNGRPGPVWIDIPLDIQATEIDISKCKRFNHLEIVQDTYCNAELIASVLQSLEKAKRPIVIAGNGVRLADCVDKFRAIIKQWGIVPVTTSYLGIDLLAHDEDQFIGRLGIKGDRAGNFAVQNADFILVLGCRLSVALTGFEYELIAREATIVVVDIDKNEHQKPTVAIDMFIHADLKDFLNEVAHRHIELYCNDWLQTCLYWKSKWSVFAEKHKPSHLINKYEFIKSLSHNLGNNSIVVSDAGSAYYVTSQALYLTGQQRYITSGAQADMGFTLPACIGVCLAKNGEVIGITGDGSLQMNIQELQTIVYHHLPIKLFVWNNNGYLSIRTTQDKFFNGRRIGTDKESGVSFPNLQKIAQAYGIAYCRVNSVDILNSTIANVLKKDEAIICEVICPENQEIIPNVSSLKRDDGTMVSKPLEDMYPYLERDEFYTQMLIKPLDE